MYFCENNSLYFTGKHHNLERLDKKEKADTIIKRSRDRQSFYELAMKMFTICDIRGLRMIVENPYSTQHYLVNNFPYKPTLIDKNRSLRGDYFNKPTQYWFINAENTNGQSYKKAKIHKTIRNEKSGVQTGLCSAERSMISPDYARNFICDFILGKNQEFTQLSLFE